MSREIQLAYKALDKVRGKIRPNRSDNKGRQGRTYAQYIERQLVGDKLQRLRQHPTNIQHADVKLENIITYGKRAMAAGVGNCLEQSCAVGSYLANEIGYYLFDLVIFSNCDHVFIAIGQPFAKQYPDNFAHWRDTATICDVWADIACRAHDFPERWRARMNNWKNIGVLPSGKQATDAYWYNAVDQDKRSFSH